MFILASLSGISIAALCAVVGIIALVAYRQRTYTTPVSKVHRPKKSTHPYPFDVEVVRRRTFAPHIAIDTSNLPAPDARVEAVLKTVLVGNVEQSIRDLSGEQDCTVGGQKVRILTRSSLSKGVEVGMQYLEQFYASLGVPTKRFPYKWRGKQLFCLEATLLGDITPNKFVIAGSHLDSTAGWTHSAEAKAPGADDDASGCVLLMELAKAIIALKKAGMKQGRTIRLLHFTGEEQGLLGSYAYSDHVVQTEKLDFDNMIQFDMVGYCAKPGNRVDIHDGADRNGSHALTVTLVREAARYKLNITCVDTHDHALEDRSDQAGFFNHGKKALLVSEEYSEDGFNPGYHSDNDRIAAMNLPYMVEIVKLSIAGYVQLAEMK